MNPEKSFFSKIKSGLIGAALLTGVGTQATIAKPLEAESGNPDPKKNIQLSLETVKDIQSVNKNIATLKSYVEAHADVQKGSVGVAGMEMPLPYKKVVVTEGNTMAYTVYIFDTDSISVVSEKEYVIENNKRELSAIRSYLLNSEGRIVRSDEVSLSDENRDIFNKATYSDGLEVLESIDAQTQGHIFKKGDRYLYETYGDRVAEETTYAPDGVSIVDQEQFHFNSSQSQEVPLDTDAPDVIARMQGRADHVASILQKVATKVTMKPTASL